MEATIIINFICFSFFLCFIILVRRRWKKPKSRRSGKLLPPGPWKLPIIGNLLHLCGSSPAHHVLRDLAKRHGSSSGLMHLQIGEISAVIVSSPEMAKEFLRTHDLVFATRPELMAAKILFYNSSDIVFSPYGDHWRQMRKICVMELLNPKLIRSFSSIRQDEIKHLLTDLRSYLERPVNLSKRISLFTSSLLCRSALGCRVFTGKEELIEVLEEMLAILGGFQFEDVFPSWKLLHNLCGNKNRIVKVHRKIDAIIENILKEHQNNFESGHELGQGGEDIIDVLIKLERNGSLQLPITHDIIKAIVLDLFVAGTETSSAVVVWAMSEMMKNPRVLAKAQAEVREAFRGKEKLEEDDIMDQLQYLKSVVKETLRCHPPGPLLGPRECMEETVVCGYTIPAKARVLINAWAISRDPQYWEDPNSFIPERFEKNSADFMGNHFEFLPFGAGRRICPGLVFGFANTLSPLANLLYHFDWSFISGITANTLDMTEMIGLTAGRKNDLFLIPTSPAAC